MLVEPRLPVMCPATPVGVEVYGLPVVPLELCPIGIDEYGLGDRHPAGKGPTGICEYHLRQMRNE